MFAIFQLAGQQYKVSEGDVFSVNAKLFPPEGNLSDEEKKEYYKKDHRVEDVMFVYDDQEKAFVEDVSSFEVKFNILEHKRSDKIVVFKKKRRKNYRRKNGHRQDMTVMRVSGIER